MEALLGNVWAIGGIGLVIGAVLAIIIMRLIEGPGSSKAELQANLDAVEEEFENHKQSVNSHFEQTSELVNDLTESYVKVYKHLSLGATQLSGAVDVSHRLTLDEDGTAASVIDGDADGSSVVADDAIEETLTELEATARDLDPDADIAKAADDAASSAPNPTIEADAVDLDAASKGDAKS